MPSVHAVAFFILWLFGNAAIGYIGADRHHSLWCIVAVSLVFNILLRLAYAR